MAQHTFPGLDGHTCGNPVRLVTGGAPFLRGETLDPHRQAPRGGEACDARVGEARFLQPRADCGEEGVGEGAERLRRQLLGADLDEEIAGRRAHEPVREAAAAPAAAGAGEDCADCADCAALAAGFSRLLRSGKPSASRLAR